MKNYNIPMKKRSIESGITLRQLALEMQIDEGTLNRKINHRKIGNTYASLSYCEKFYIAYRLDMDIELID